VAVKPYLVEETEEGLHEIEEVEDKVLMIRPNVPEAEI
jgi:hypothetical protein